MSEESPSQVGIGTQDHLQAKTLWPVQAGGMGSDDNLPPGFEGIQPANSWTIKLSQIPLVKWKCPPRVCLIDFYFVFFHAILMQFFSRVEVFLSCSTTAVSDLKFH